MPTRSPEVLVRSHTAVCDCCSRPLGFRSTAYRLTLWSDEAGEEVEVRVCMHCYNARSEVEAGTAYSSALPDNGTEPWECGLV